MRHDRRHQLFAKAALAVRLKDKDVGDVPIGREVGNHARETNLPGIVVNAEAQRIFDRALDSLARDSLGPVRTREEFVNYIDVELRSIGADQESAHLHHHHRRHVTLAPLFAGNRYSITCAGIGVEASSRASATGINVFVVKAICPAQTGSAKSASSSLLSASPRPRRRASGSQRSRECRGGLQYEHEA